ncbi:MAG: hypothetical protein WDA27_15165 [Actinomycetota bacterium]
MQTEQLIALILSPLTASALVALLRRHLPKLDGPYLVPGVVVLLAIVGNVLPVLAGTITLNGVLNAIVAGIVGGLTVSGIVQIGQDAGKKGQTPAETNALDVIPPAPKAPTIIRDTTPEDTTHAE